MLKNTLSQMANERKYALVSIFCFFFTLYNAYGQYNIRTISKIKGLSTRTVSSISQDSDGFIWIGTTDGVSRYDGFELKEYKSSSIKGKDVIKILVDSSDRLWVGTTDGGLNLYNKSTDSFITYEYVEGIEGSINSNDVRGLHCDEHGNVWVATKHALNLYLEDEYKFKVYEGPFTNTLLKDITSDNKGNIWCATYSGGLYKFDPSEESFQEFLNEYNSAPKIQTIAFDGKDILIGTSTQGLLQFDLTVYQTRKVFEMPSRYIDANIWDLNLNQDNSQLWVGTDGNGLVTLKKINNNWEEEAIFQNLKANNDLINSVFSTFVDKDNNLWIGSAWKGLYVIESLNNPIEYISDIDGENRVSVWAINKESDRTVIGTDGHGIYVYPDKSVNRNQEIINYFEGYRITKILKRDDGNYWLGTNSNGLILVNKDLQVLRRYRLDTDSENSISSNSILDLLQDSNGLWIATWAGGLNYLNEKTQLIEHYQFDPNDVASISNNNVVTLQLRDNENIWVGTFGGGLNLLDTKTKKFERFQYDLSNRTDVTFPSKNITSVYEDGNENIWLGFWNNGLKKVNLTNDSITHFNQYPGLIDKTVCGIVEDNNQNVWINTVDRVFKYNPILDSILQYSDLKNEYQLRSFCKDSDGTIYYGSLSGVVSFDPKKMVNLVDSAKVHFTDFKLFNETVIEGPESPITKHINLAEQINLTYDQRVITFDFAALVLPSSEDIEYVIKMDNFDRNWRNIGTDRSATYTNLAPGNYQFNVKATNQEGSLISDVASIPVIIAKPLWAKWWAFLIYFVLLVIILYLFRRANINRGKMKSQLKFEQLSREKETELHELKLKFFTNISHEIRTPVTLILGSTNRLLDMGVTEKSQLNALQNIQKSGSHLFKLVTELLDFRKLEIGEARLKVAEGNLANFTKEIFLSFSDQALQKDISYNYHALIDSLQVWYDRDEMEKVLYNIISNAFKYTPDGGRIDVSLETDDQHTFVSVKDNGRGIPGEQLKDIFKRFYQSDSKVNLKHDSGFGLGLSITHEIVKLHGGELLVESEENVGSKFIIKLPLGRDHVQSEFLIEDFKDSEQLSHYDPSIEDKTEEVVFNFPNQSSLSVLVAEDNEGIREYINDLLSPHFKVLLAENGVEAMDLAFEHLPDLILTDVMMPEMDGITFSSKIKHDPRTSHIPIIILTARTSLIYKKEGLDIGVDDYITKPFNEIILKTRIRNILHNRMLLREKLKTDILIQPSELAVRSPDQEFLNNVAQVLDQNLDSSNLSTEFLCRELAMSQSNVYKKLKALTGMSIVEFIRDFRLKRAVQLIIQQKLSVSEACYKVGFSDRRYFSQVFKAKYGETPSQYAKNQLGAAEESIS
jgi:signal transduction histidine kinase/ligand-binding sensor domain-containing protein/DNA-binding response OmpR family regulator